MGKIACSASHLRLDAVCTWSLSRWHWHQQGCNQSSHSCRPWCLRNFHNLGFNSNPLFPIILSMSIYAMSQSHAIAAAQPPAPPYFAVVCIQCEALSGGFATQHMQPLVLVTTAFSFPQSHYSPGSFLMATSTFFLRSRLGSTSWCYWLGCFKFWFWGWEICLSDWWNGSVLCLKYFFKLSKLHFCPGSSFICITVWPLLTLLGTVSISSWGEVYLYHLSSGWIYVMLLDRTLHTQTNDITHILQQDSYDLGILSDAVYPHLPFGFHLDCFI